MSPPDVGGVTLHNLTIARVSSTSDLHPARAIHRSLITNIWGPETISRSSYWRYISSGYEKVVWTMFGIRGKYNFQPIRIILKDLRRVLDYFVSYLIHRQVGNVFPVELWEILAWDVHRVSEIE